MASRCDRCGRRLAVGDIVETRVPADEAIEGVIIKAPAETRHHPRCPPHPLRPTVLDDDLPKRPGRGWLVSTCEEHGLPIVGTGAELVARLRAIGFPPMEPPGDRDGVIYGVPR